MREDTSHLPSDHKGVHEAAGKSKGQGVVHDVRHLHTTFDSMEAVPWYHNR